ncbi:asparagine synthase (glutamine-hydrolyzing) [Botryobacter ruber]|uniref:asparagine synthase (glutamine-hydrolyzing) n=1 Tax=Botryobacter ruber TaxID=2171629 RepID=UPI000E0ACB86|nr:asparagine synthase (glutamine-hydrolyzing) [Botryobacter ruber]
MCGINGIIGSGSISGLQQVMAKMNKAIAHRGPDDSGIFEEHGIALGQNRLSIIDLSAAGHQPMISADGNEVLVFNGEIYNYRELRSELYAYPFATQTDSEVILAAFKQWGGGCVHRLKGMFAFAIWDKQKQELFVARDRLGIKPLYYHRSADTLIFSSEIRSLLKSGLVQKKINKIALSDYLRYQTVHAPATMVEGVSMLLPGHTMTIKAGKVAIQRYWSPEENASAEAQDKDYGQIKKDVKELLAKAVERRLVADVPFGAFLSGGIDSSVVVGLMSEVAVKQVKTFAVTFEEEAFSEAKYAAAIARKFNTDHTEIKLRSDDFLELIPSALKAMDHPSGDGPNTYVVSKVTKEAGITMALSGLGGDEVFGGYDVFRRLTTLKQYAWLNLMPKPLKRVAGKSLVKLRPGVASSKMQQLLNAASWNLEHTYPITRQILSDSLIKELLDNDQAPQDAVQQIVHESQERQGRSLPFLSQISVAEMQTYMQNTLLRDTDQMSMAHALEVRVPFLDHDLVEYVFGVPDQYKYPSTPKKLLVDAVSDLLPSEIVNRPKMGFTLPWKEWLRTDLRGFCEQKINNLARRGILSAVEVHKLWQSFLQLDPSVTWSRVWYLIVLENWLEENGIE